MTRMFRREMNHCALIIGVFLRHGSRFCYSYTLLTGFLRYSAYTEGYHHPSTLSIMSGLSTAYKRYHMKDRCVIYSGLIQMIDVAGVFHLVGLDTLSDRTFLKPLIIITG
jgi:hypothetical protein